MQRKDAQKKETAPVLWFQDNPYAEKRSTIDFWRGLTDLEGDDVVGAALVWESKEEELRLPHPAKKRLEPTAAASPKLKKK